MPPVHKRSRTKKMTRARGVPVEVRLYLPDEAMPVDVDRAVVRWAIGREFELEFLRIGPEAQARLGRFLSTLEAGSSH